MRTFSKISIISLMLLFVLLGVFFGTEWLFKASKGHSTVSKVPNDGKYKEYYEDGSIYSVEYYENGSKEGIWRYYYENGHLKSRIPYSNNQRNGFIWHFSQDGQLIFKENFRNDTLISRDIINDSLYKYEIVFESHGKEMFNKSCTPCHNNSSVKELRFGVENLEVFIDTMGITQLSIDSIHKLNIDSLDSRILTGEVEMGPSPLHSLEKYDLEAILEYLEKEYERAESSGKKKVKKVRERKKTVYLINRTAEPLAP